MLSMKHCLEPSIRELFNQFMADYHKYVYIDMTYNLYYSYQYDGVGMCPLAKFIYIHLPDLVEGVIPPEMNIRHIK